MGLLYLDLQSPDYPAEVNHFFKQYEEDLDKIIELLRREDDNWDTVANTKLCNIANEYGKLDNEKMEIIGKAINKKAYERF